MIRVVLFDFGGVLTEGGKKGFIGQMVAELYGAPESELNISELHETLRRGKTADDVLFGRLNERYGKQVTKEDFVRKTEEFSKPSLPVYKLAAHLRAHGIRTAVFSNVYAMNAERLQELGRYDGFDPVILSCYEGYAKPDREFYEIALQKTGVAAHEMLLIDDQVRCIEAAQACGMHAIRALSPDQIVADTEALLQKENGITL